LATAIHFLVTLSLAACAAAVIFLVWFPDPFQTMLGGTELFILVVGCDLVLGPLISLVIYNSRKSRGKLVLDYSVIGALQLAALAYGVFILAGTRPVYVAFSTDRLEVVTARDIADSELAAARDPAYRSLPLTGPRLVNIDVPAADHNDALFQSLSGNEEHMRPRFYASYETGLAKIRARAKPIAKLAEKLPASKPLLDAAVAGLKIPPERVRWLGVHHRRGFWTALIDLDDGRPVAYLDIDPY
jgi:hypothetical protein